MTWVYQCAGEDESKSALNACKGGICHCESSDKFREVEGCRWGWGDGQRQGDPVRGGCVCGGGEREVDCKERWRGGRGGLREEEKEEEQKEEAEGEGVRGGGGEGGRGRQWKVKRWSIRSGCVELSHFLPPKSTAKSCCRSS